MDGQSVLIPFSFKNIPMKKLAIINFEKNPDHEYVGLELQYFSGGDYGMGYRVIAYRNDRYVDVYDDLSLNHIPDEQFDVAGKGLCERRTVAINDTVFEKGDCGLKIFFSFVDKYNREIVVRVTERSKKWTRGINLLAPIGSSSEKPTNLPLFYLYGFDFIRKYKTESEVMIDNKHIQMDNFPFPFPKDLQWRYYSRYSTECQIIEFAKSMDSTLEIEILDGNNTVAKDGIIFHYDERKALLKISMKKSEHPFSIEFKNGFPDIHTLTENEDYADTFIIRAGDVMGSISGHYTITRYGNTIDIELLPSGGWSPATDSFLTKILFGQKSVFSTWPKAYQYKQRIDLTTLKSNSSWENTR
ncbi:MAG: hypothetical protein Q8S24_03125 [Eubacteriales bacterium]|nr:hypothetical protein [Eubacteriales bacterium]